MSDTAGSSDPIFDSILSLPSLRDAVADAAEAGLEAVANSPIIDKIPVVGFLRALVGGAFTVREVLLVKKLAALLDGIGLTDDALVQE